MKNHVGETVGIYEIVELMPNKTKYNHNLYKGICIKCGAERIARYQDLKESKICTHIRVDGGSYVLKANWNNKYLKGIFNGIKQRCYNENSKDYRWYGAKGIKIYKDWLDDPSLFEEWAMQNGYEIGLTIDRINENKDYAPDNCRWITGKQNAKYKSTTSLINVDGEEHTGRDWSKILGLGTNRINTYIREYGLENTVEFIRRYMLNPNLRPCNKNKSIYSIYMN